MKATLDTLKAEIDASSEPIPESLVAILGSGTNEKQRRTTGGGEDGESAIYSQLYVYIYTVSICE